MSARILVVDDETYVRQLLSRILRRLGHEVEVAENAAGALELMRAGPFDVVLTDVVMDGGDGFELLRAVKALRPETKVIVLTGYARHHSISDFLLYGADDFLTKPFEVRAIEAAIDSALGEAVSGDSAL